MAAGAPHGEDEEVFTLLEIEDVFVFKMPATSSAAGYRAADMKEQVWDGTLKIMQKGQRAAIQLIGRDGKLFCLAPVTADGPPAYEPVSDSSRYFVLRIANAAGRHAFVGLAFQERAHAFDFKSTLADFEQELKLQASGKSRLQVEDKKIESLEEGQTIKLSIGSTGGRSKRAPRSKRTTGGLRAPGGGLKPPPSTHSSAPSATAAPQEDTSDPFASFGAAPTPAPAPAPAPAGFDDDPFAGL
ncbi:NECAP1 [Symbiodinium sp. KB8]|nr:NECAP1 [Symbiodinium sp. KB8]